MISPAGMARWTRQLYANLRGAAARGRDPGEIPAGFLRDLGVPGTGIPEGIDERARMYRARPPSASIACRLMGRPSNYSP